MTRLQSFARALRSTQQFRAALPARHYYRYHRSSAASTASPLTRCGLLGSVVTVLVSVYSCMNVAQADTGSRPTLNPASGTISAKDVEDNQWVVIDKLVYDVTSFALIHPGGEEVLQEAKGTDISSTFHALHSEDALDNALGTTALKHLGTLAEDEHVPKFDLEEHLVEQRRKDLPPVHTITNLASFERLAKEVLGPESRAWHFISSVAEDGVTFKSNREAYSFLRFRPRVNCPVEECSTSTTFLGKETPMPVFMSPTGGSGNAHPEGELNATCAAASTGVPQIVSSMSSVSFSALAKARDRLERETKLRARLWWQLYIMKDRAESEKRIKNAVENGAEVIVITVDVATPGKREVAGRVFQGDGRKAQKTESPEVAVIKPSLFTGDMRWSDIDWVRSIAPGLSIVIKGVATVQDIVLAKEHGADGVVLSNHGGRQLDGAPPPLATLAHARLTAPELLDDPKFEVFIDGGVHRGTDVLKALCLGARGVGLGRAVLYAQACYGAEGVTRVFQILREEILIGMRLLGCTKVNELNPNLVEMLDGGLVGRPFQ